MQPRRGAPWKPRHKQLRKQRLMLRLHLMVVVPAAVVVAVAGAVGRTGGLYAHSDRV